MISMEYTQGETIEVRKDEAYVKALLSKCYKGEGNFQRFEFCTNQMETRPDFVILGDKYFKFFEIKTELDSFARIRNQITLTTGYCSHFYIVIPRDRLMECKKHVPNHWGVGYIFIEDLEEGICKPAIEPERFMTPRIESIANLLWVDDLRRYVKQKFPTAYCYQYGKNKLTLSSMPRDYLQKYFELLYGDNQSYEILNDVLCGRHQEELFVKD